MIFLLIIGSSGYNWIIDNMLEAGLPSYETAVKNPGGAKFPPLSEFGFVEIRFRAVKQYYQVLCYINNHIIYF